MSEKLVIKTEGKCSACGASSSATGIRSDYPVIVWAREHAKRHPGHDTTVTVTPEGSERGMREIIFGRTKTDE